MDLQSVHYLPILALKKTMPLSNFFYINMPYGMKRNDDGEWFVFNREYLPIGWSNKKDERALKYDGEFGGIPIYTRYKSLSDKRLLSLAATKPTYNIEDEIITIFFYKDGILDVNGRVMDKIKWSDYLKRLEILASLKKA